MLPIFALSFYTFYVIVLKVIQLKNADVFRENFIELTLTKLRIGDWAQAEKDLEKEVSPVAKVMLRALKLAHYKDLPEKRIEPEIERVGLVELNKLKSHLRGLEVIAAVAPLLGLLGTVIGMVKAFAKLAENTTRIDPSVLAGGIWEALITTIAGLLVAIPAFFAYYYFAGKVEKVRTLMKDSATQILNLRVEENQLSPLREIAERIEKIEADIYQEQN